MGAGPSEASDCVVRLTISLYDRLLPGKALKELIPGLQKLPVSDRLKIIQHATGDLLEVRVQLPNSPDLSIFHL